MTKVFIEFSVKEINVKQGRIHCLSLSCRCNYVAPFFGIPAFSHENVEIIRAGLLLDLYSVILLMWRPIGHVTFSYSYRYTIYEMYILCAKCNILRQYINLYISY